jgi:hypothetical protein
MKNKIHINATYFTNLAKTTWNADHKIARRVINISRGVNMDSGSTSGTPVRIPTFTDKHHRWKAQQPGDFMKSTLVE